jgi:hypothetical protein
MKKLLALIALLQAIVAFPVAAPVTAPVAVSVATPVVVAATAAVVAAVAAEPAQAAEHITSLSAGSPQTGWSWSVDHWVASNVRNQRLSFVDPTLIAGHTYRFDVQMGSWSSGGLKVVINAPPASIPTATWINAVDINGLAPIPDNFITANGIIAGNTSHDDDSPDPSGAFRARCGYAKVLPDDPLLFPNAPGRSHFHIFYGNTGINAHSNYESLRKSGGTSCGDPAAPVYRSSIWTPVITDGANIKLPIRNNLYYKTIPANSDVCLPIGSSYDPAVNTNKAGTCGGNRLPNGIRWVFGYDMGNQGAAHPGGPTDGDPMEYACYNMAGQTDKAPTHGTYHTLKAMYDAGCRSPGVIFERIGGPTCWDGVHVDSPDHRSHVARVLSSTVTTYYNYWDGTNNIPKNTQWAQCPATHPVVIPDIELQLFYVLDAAWDAGKWHLSCDEQMNMPMDAGTCLHQDYWEAWSPTVKGTWATFCQDRHRDGQDASLCNGTTLKGKRANSGMDNYSFEPATFGGEISLTKFGYSRTFSGNGHFVGEITPKYGGMASLIGDGLTANVLSFSVIDVTKNTNYTPSTVHVGP